MNTKRAKNKNVPTANLFETDSKLHVPVVIFSTQDNVNLLDQLKSGFKRKINRDKY